MAKQKLFDAAPHGRGSLFQGGDYSNSTLSHLLVAARWATAARLAMPCTARMRALARRAQYHAWARAPSLCAMATATRGVPLSSAIVPTRSSDALRCAGRSAWCRECLASQSALRSPAIEASGASPSILNQCLGAQARSSTSKIRILCPTLVRKTTLRLPRFWGGELMSSAASKHVASKMPIFALI